MAGWPCKRSMMPTCSMPAEQVALIRGSERLATKILISVNKLVANFGMPIIAVCCAAMAALRLASGAQRHVQHVYKGTYTIDIVFVQPPLACTLCTLGLPGHVHYVHLVSRSCTLCTLVCWRSAPLPGICWCSAPLPGICLLVQRAARASPLWSTRVGIRSRERRRFSAVAPNVASLRAACTVYCFFAHSPASCRLDFGIPTTMPVARRSFFCR